MGVVGMLTAQLKHLLQASHDIKKMHKSNWDRRDMKHHAPIEFKKNSPANASDSSG